MVPAVPSTVTSATAPTLTDGTCALVSVAVASNDFVPMMTMSSVAESALTVSPTLIPTETIVPLIGLVSCPSARDCSATMTLDCAVSIAASSDAICAALSEAEPLAEVPLGLVAPLPEAPVGVAAAEAELPLVLPEPDEEDSSCVMALASVDSSEATVRWSEATAS